ncbi:MAG: FAD-dependent oxidoreductase [Clostridiaceae bacterium]|nr:FAD-dependent oxidoreductase [Clostridiaceae bacterium]
MHRYHGDIVVYHDAEDVVVLKPGEDYEDHQDQLVEKYDVKSGYWWIELGGDWDDIIRQAEDIRYELYRTVYGVWDHIKNGGDHGAVNYELVWGGSVAGSRESRRLIGDEVLTENDILANRVFENGIAYGGWPMDEHTARQDAQGVWQNTYEGAAAGTVKE